MTKHKVISCFSGIAGLCEGGIAEAGLQDTFQVVQFVESEPHRQRILNARFPNIPVHGDIRTYHPNFQPFVLVGGFPCRGTSSAGKRRGFENQHSALWWEMLRVIIECQPRFVLIENPTGFVHRGLRECLTHLRMAGYCWDNPQVVSAAEVGAPHQRDRVFVIAYPNGSLPCVDKLPPTWERQTRAPVEEDHCDRSRPSEQRELSGMADGLPSWLADYCRGGWWLENLPLPTIGVPKRSDPQRHANISALGDSCTPQQAAVMWRRVKQLLEVQNTLRGSDCA